MRFILSLYTDIPLAMRCIWLCLGEDLVSIFSLVFLPIPSFTEENDGKMVNRLRSIRLASNISHVPDIKRAPLEDARKSKTLVKPFGRPFRGFRQWTTLESLRFLDGNGFISYQKSGRRHLQDPGRYTRDH